jgi:hypothetical protein
MRYAHLNVECQFLKKQFLVKSGHFWSSVLVKLPSKVYPKSFFSYQVLLHALNKYKHSTFGLQLLKKSPKYGFFFSFLAIFPIFKTEARSSTLKSLKSRRYKICSKWVSATFETTALFNFWVWNFPIQKRSSLLRIQILKFVKNVKNLQNFVSEGSLKFWKIPFFVKLKFQKRIRLGLSLKFVIRIPCWSSEQTV